MATADPTMLAMMDRHTTLLALFLAHQTALLDRDLASAADALERFTAALRAHMEEEESRILPLYAARAPQPAGGGTQMFLDEHKKLREFTTSLSRALAALAPAGEQPTPASILALLDQETMVKGYLDHHDRRERAFLYPGLDSVLTVEERRALLSELGFPAG